MKGNEQKQEFERNVEAATRLHAKVPAGCRMTVVGSNDRSFAQSYILLCAELSNDSGHFEERLAAPEVASSLPFGNGQRVSARRPRRPIFSEPYGCVRLFRVSPRYRNVLVIFSDMRQDAPALDLDRLQTVNSVAVKKVGKERLLPNLHAVEVYALGRR